MKRALWLFLLLLVACGDQIAPPPNAAALPVLPTLQPAITSVPVPPTPVQPTRIATVAQPSASTALTLTFANYREPRGVFTLDVPTTWRTTALPDGIGLITIADYATANVTLSLAWQAERLSATSSAQIVEQYKTRLLESYLTKNLQLSGASDAERYTLRGTATLTGMPTTIEISLYQTAGGTVVLQSWLAPTAVWPDFERIFKTPMQQSLTIDDAATKQAVGE